MPSVVGKQPEGRLMPESTPVHSQRFKQSGAQHDITVFPSLAAPDVNDHPLAVDVADLEVRHLRSTSSRGIERHQQDAMKGRLCSIDKTSDFLLAEHLWQVQHLLRVGSLSDTPGSLQHLNVEEAQSCQPLRDGVRRQLPGTEHGCLILPDMLRTEPVGWTMEVPGEEFDGADVTADGRLGVVATLQLLKHDLT